MKVALFAAAGVFAMLASSGRAADPPAPRDAQSWVAMVDRGDYGRSWSQAGALFKSHISAADWATQVGSARRPLGALVSRKLKDEKTTTALPGAPDGRYDVVQFDSEFANKKTAVETLVMSQEPAGWKVDGYFIR